MDPEQSLVLDIINYHFEERPFVYQICKAFLTHGALSFTQLKQQTHLNPTQVKESLHVGLQHNFIYWTNEEDTTFYHFISKNIRYRLCYPRALLLARKKMERGELILKELVQLGCCTTADLIQHLCDVHLGLMGGVEFGIEEEKLEITKALDLLRKEKYIITVQKMREGVGREEYVGGSIDLEKVRATIMESASKIGNKRNMTFDTEVPNKKKRQEKDTVGNDEEIIEGDISELLCINMEKFNYEFQKEEVLSFISKKLNKEASYVIKFFFQFAEEHDIIKELQYYPVSQSELNTLLGQQSEKCMKYIDLLLSDDHHFLEKMHQHKDEDPKYYLNLPGILAQMKHNLVLNIMKQKFPKNGQSIQCIFQILYGHKDLEEQQIADMAILPIHEAHDCLQKLQNHGYVHSKKLYLSSDPVPKFIFWSISTLELHQRLVREIQKSISNLSFKMKCERERHQPLLLKQEDQERLYSEGSNREIFTDSEKKQLELLEFVDKQIQNAVIQLDGDMRLLSDRSEETKDV